MTKKQAAEEFDRLAGDLEELSKAAHIAAARMAGTNTRKHRNNERDKRFFELNEEEQKAVIVLNEQGWQVWWGMELLNVDGTKSKVRFCMVKVEA